MRSRSVKQIALSFINFPDNAYPYLFILIVLASDVEIIDSLRIALPLSLSLSGWLKITMRECYVKCSHKENFSAQLTYKLKSGLFIKGEN